MNQNITETVIKGIDLKKDFTYISTYSLLTTSPRELLT